MPLGIMDNTFDVDFSDIDAVFRHLQDKYGKKNVARVGAFNRFTCKSAIRKIMGVYGFSQKAIKNIIDDLPNDGQCTIDEAMQYSKIIKEFFKQNDHILQCVKKLEGCLSHMSTHAGGVIICEGLTEKLPVWTMAEDREKLIVGFDKKIIEALGHYKFDILGLNYLTLMKNALDNIDEEIDWAKINFEDKNIYDMLSNGDVYGVFQLSEQKDKVMEQKPYCFEDLITINALIRPGVGDWNEYLDRRYNDREGEYESYMQCTNGLIVYQDQYLLLAQTYAGWDIAFSDKHIRKNKDIVNDNELRRKFISDSLSRGFNESLVTQIWNNIEKVVAGGYGFNRAHSTSYAKLSYQTAYLKYYYPAAFYTACLTANQGDTEALNKIRELTNKSGINLVAPNINKGSNKFKIYGNDIMFALTAINGVGESAYRSIINMRPIKSFNDFMERRVPRDIKSNTVVALIKAGAFDFDTKDRNELLKRITGEEHKLPNYAYEKESFGFYISKTPYDKYDVKPLEDYVDGQLVTTVAEITQVAERNDRNNNKMAFVSGVNKNGNIRFIFFSSIWKNNKVQENQMYIIKGRKDKDSILVNSVEVIG